MSLIKRIRKAVREERLEFTLHALDELDNDLLSQLDIRTVLLHGAIQERQDDHVRGSRYVIRGATDDDLDVAVVCRFSANDILWVITVFVVNEPE